MSELNKAHWAKAGHSGLWALLIATLVNASESNSFLAILLEGNVHLVIVETCQ